VNSEGTTVILATHDRSVVDALGVRVIRLENGKIVRDSIGGYVGEATIERREIVKEAEKMEVAPEAPAHQSRIHLHRGTHVPKPRGGSHHHQKKATHVEEAPEARPSDEPPTTGTSGKIKPIAV